MATSSRSLDLDIVTLRRIYIRNPTSNALVQSNYALLSDGNGGTYWSTVITGTALSSFSTSIGTSFTSQLINSSNLLATNLTATNLTATNLTTTNFTAQNFTPQTIVASNFRLPNLALCNIFIDSAWSLASNYPKLVSSNLNYYLSNDDMGSYLFCQSPSNINFIPPGVRPAVGVTNPFSGQSQGNFFTLKNLGSNILNVVTNPTTSYQVITSTTATFFYVGAPQNFWTPM